MNKKYTFDLRDINEDFFSQVAFYIVSYSSGLGGPGYVVALTVDGNEYILNGEGAYMKDQEMINLFPDAAKCLSNRYGEEKDENGFCKFDNWYYKYVGCHGYFIVREDYFPILKEKCEYLKELNKEALDYARAIVGAPGFDERMVYIKTQQTWDEEDKDRQKHEEWLKEDRLTGEDVKWVKFGINYPVGLGFYLLLLKKCDDGTICRSKWTIQYQLEQIEEGHLKNLTSIECYNLFYKRYENIIELKPVDKPSFYYESLVGNDDSLGEFWRSYKTLEEAKKAALIRNEFIGWGSFYKSNLIRIDYNLLQKEEN